MRRLALLVLLNSTSALTMSCPPTFGMYPSATWVSGHASPRLDTPGKRMFRTMIRLGASSGDRFSDRHRLAVWGCGSGCQQGALVDTRSGEVIPVPDATLRYGVRPGSRLLIVSPLQQGETLADRRQTVFNAPPAYYVLQGYRLVRVCTP